MKEMKAQQVLLEGIFFYRRTLLSSRLEALSASPGGRWLVGRVLRCQTAVSLWVTHGAFNTAKADEPAA